MLVPLVRIGNSKGVRLPKAVIEQAGLTDQIELEVQEGRIILTASTQPRAGWDVAAEACHEAGDDDLGDWETTLNDFEGSWS